MTTYTIKHTDGSRSIEETSMDACIGVLADLYGSEIEVGDEEQDGMQDEDGGQPMRRLVWANEEDAKNDSGVKAVASIRWTD
jgi:hypothetical protein